MGTEVEARTPESTPVVTARRRLLRGSFAAPTVLTLCSGSALAASSALRCFSNAPAGVAASTVPDNIWRVARYRTRVNGVTFQVFSGSDIRRLEGANAPRLALGRFESGKWYRAETGAETAVGSGSANAPARDGVLLALRLGVVDPTALKPQFVVLGVAAGNSPAGPGKIMTTSCWTSVM